VYEVPLPAVVTVKEGLNLPRYPSVPGRLRAKRKPLETRAPERRDPGVEKVRLRLPAGQGKQTQMLGQGASAAVTLHTPPGRGDEQQAHDRPQRQNGVELGQTRFSVSVPQL